MAKTINLLSARFVETTEKPGRHADGGGLYLSISPDGSRRRWVLLYTFRGKRREMGLGTAPGGSAEVGAAAQRRAGVVSLKDARNAAEKAQALINIGVDPISDRRAQKTKEDVLTFGQMADRHIEAMETGWRNEKHVAQWRMTLGRVRNPDGSLTNGGYCLALRDVPVNEVTTEDVLAVLKPIWNTKAETASRVRGRIEAVLDAAKAGGYRSGENPAAWRGHLALLLPKAKKLARGHHPAMPYTDIPAFMGKLRAASGVGSRALEFLILTAARSGEVRGARWDEVDIENELWTVPADRMKAGKKHRVPLTPRALAVLEIAAALRRKCDGDDALIFPGMKHGVSLSDMTLAAAMKRLGAGEFTAHGFRSAFRDWAGDCTHYPRELAEQALAHAIGDAVEAAYRRGDAIEKRKNLMRDWAAYVEPKVANIVPMRRGGKRSSEDGA